MLMKFLEKKNKVQILKMIVDCFAWRSDNNTILRQLCWKQLCYLSDHGLWLLWYHISVFATLSLPNIGENWTVFYASFLSEIWLSRTNVDFTRYYMRRQKPE